MSRIMLVGVLLLAINTETTQSQNATLENRQLIDAGIEFSTAAGVGGNIGYTNLSVNSGRLSHFGVSVVYKDDGVDKHGERYDNIGQNEFPQDVVDDGYAFYTVSGQGGIKITNWMHVLAIVEYQGANFVQRRVDDTTILGNNGRYYTEYRDPEKSGIGGGGGLKFLIPSGEGLVITGMIQATTKKALSLSFGLAFSSNK